MSMCYKYRRNIQSVRGLNLAPRAPLTLHDTDHDDDVEQDGCQEREKDESDVEGTNECRDVIHQR